MTTELKPRPNGAAGRGFGWKPDVPDLRDFAYEPPERELHRLPPEVRLDEDAAMPEVYDQGQLGSCTANALGAALEYQLGVEGKDSPMPSRLFVYWGERFIEGTTGYDAGAQIRDGVKVLAKDGAPPEALWPYDIGRFAEQPPQAAFDAAKAARVTRYARVRRRSEYWRCALAKKRPVVFGFSVYESFEDGAWPGFRMPQPQPSEQLLGGHAVLAVGYATINGVLYWRVRNSWSAQWGDGGYFWMPASYTENAATASDFWVLTDVAAGA